MRRKAAARAIGNNAIAMRCDVTQKSNFTAAVEDTLSAFGALDILVNNAGTTHVNKPMLEITEDEYDRTFAVNVKGVFLGCQAVVPVSARQGGGVIINIGSTAGLRPRPGVAAYSATKGAVHTLTKSLAGELAGDRIRVCAIAPVATDTPLLPSFLGPAPGMREKFIATVPLGRLAVVQDIANAALFLASRRRRIRHRQYRRGRRRPLRLGGRFCHNLPRSDLAVSKRPRFCLSERFLSAQALVYRRCARGRHGMWGRKRKAGRAGRG